MSASGPIRASSSAAVATDRADRYDKQLASHLGRRNGGEWSIEDRSGWIDLGSGRATMTADENALHITIDATDGNLPRLQEVVASHLARFGERDELEVSWTTPEQDGSDR